MFDLVAKHKRVAQVILFLLMVPFAFFGVDYYFRGGAADAAVATVGKEDITQADYAEALREQSDQMRRQMGKNFDPAMFDSPEVRFAVLEMLINQRLLAGKAQDEKFRVTDAQLQQVIAGIPAFQEDGKFSPDRYRMLLQSQNMTPLYFEQKLRQDLLVGAVQEPVGSANIVARPSALRFLGLLEQRREVELAAVDIDPFLRDVKVDDAQVKDFYDKNPTAFQTPEQARIEYVLLTADALTAQAAVTPDEVRKQYDANVRQYTAPEERAAAHILIPVKPDASDAEKAAAKKLADDVHAKAKANPAKFGDLAKEFSKDPGSAEQGGDLGNFGRGTMVKPFEDAVFAAKAGDLLAPVQSDFGWHVIKVTGARAERTQAYEEVAAQIEADLKKQKAGQKFAAAADQFQNLVYEQADSLAGVAKALDLKVQATPLITRSQAQAIGLGNPKFVQALFSPESIQSKRNTEAMEVAPNTLIAGRIVEFKPAAPRPFADVAGEIRVQLTRRAASELAQKAGRAKLALLEAGKSDKEAGVAFGKPLTVGRGEFQSGLPPEVMKGVFQANPDKLPALTGGPNERGGFSIVRVNKVFTPTDSDKQRVDMAASRLSDQLGRELLNAYIASLRAKADVKINQANLEKK
ncbi:MAG: SurA N-terminal domain-containing protein [Betaproteobacteria bacterium]|nr:SurA N-terminal domain-containing protein [Betaproteobacteria bacterium]